MTIRQFYYTSCEQGADGIQGFQVNSITPGVDRAQVDAGLPFSLYRPPPDSQSLPTPEQLREFPVAVGYRRYDGYSLLFQSRYLGADFTGRQGNYFAHVLVLDGSDAEFRSSLPIASWGADLWTWQIAAGSQLPTLRDIPKGSLTAAGLGQYLRSGHLPEFGAVLSAVQDSLQKQSSRVIIVAQTDHEVARAIDAVTRSLPPDLALMVSFNTYSAAPNNADVLVVGTTPDVTISASPFAQQTVLRIGAAGATGAPAGPVSRYARVLTECWTGDPADALEAVAIASRIAPAIQPSELDNLSYLIQLIVAEAPSSSPGFQLLPALEFALARSPESLLPLPVRSKVAKLTDREPADLDIARWSGVLAAAQTRNLEILSSEFSSVYLTAVLTQIVAGRLDPSAVWLPSPIERRQEREVLAWADEALVGTAGGLAEAAVVLNAVDKVGVALPDATLHRLAERVVLPRLLDPATSSSTVSELSRFLAAKRLLLIVTELLEAEINLDEIFDAVVEELPLVAVQLLSPFAGRNSRCALAFAIVQARVRAGGFDPVAVLAQATRGHAAGAVDRFADLLWSEPPTAAEAVSICRTMRSQLRGSNRLLSKMVGRLEIDARGPGLGSEHVALAKALEQADLHESSAELRTAVWCVLEGDFFRSSLAVPAAKDRAVNSARVALRVTVEIADWLLEAVADWMLGLGDAYLHEKLLRAIIRPGGNPRFFLAYRRRLAIMLRDGPPDLIAAVLPALVYCGSWDVAVRNLLTSTCVDNLNGRKKRDLAAIGESLDRTDEHLRGLLRSPKGAAPPSWPEWWLEWQEANIERSLVNRLFGRRRAKAAD